MYWTQFPLCIFSQDEAFILCVSQQARRPRSASVLLLAASSRQALAEMSTKSGHEHSLGGESFSRKLFGRHSRFT